jgi:hypothetical protein
MKIINSIHPLEPRMEKLIEGYRGFPQPHFPLAFRERPLLPEEVTSLFMQGLDLFAEVRRCEARLKLAIEARHQAIPRLHVLVREASKVARHHFGADAQKMASFGITRPAIAKPRSKRKPCTLGLVEVTEVVEEVTEIGRGTSGKRRGAKRRGGKSRV